MPRKFWKVALEKNWDHVERSCEIWRSTAQRQGGKEYPTYNKKKEGEKWREDEDEDVSCYWMIFKETRGQWKLKAETLDVGTLWRTRFARFYAPVPKTMEKTHDTQLCTFASLSLDTLTNDLHCSSPAITGSQLGISMFITTQATSFLSTIICAIWSTGNILR